jgi:hypothetical protein
MTRQAYTSNWDGLVQGYGTRTTDNNVAAVTSERGSVKTLVMEISGKDAASSWAANTTQQAVQSNAVRIPRGSLIKSATFQTVVPFTSDGAATLSIGTYSATDMVTGDVVAGITSATGLSAIDGIGETVVAAGTLVNSTIPVGATSHTDVIIGFNYGAAAFTAGKGILTVQYIEPSSGNVIAA